MENLWEREENQNRYVDLFASLLENEIQVNRPKESIKLNLSAKNNQRSTELRNAGNEKFLSGKVFDAIGYYNQSLCFGETGSENIALAYVHRSACFSRLKMPAKAFRDIQLAKEANLPERMRSKVEKCEQQCQKLMDCSEKCANWLKLSYEADKNYTSMANVLEIAQNDVFGRHVVAKCDIPVGKIVLLEECFIGCTKDGYDMCYSCYRQMENFIPCPNCPDILFCSSECLDRNSIHKWECGTVSIKNDVETKLAIDAVVVAIEAFSDVESLMNFVDLVLRDEDPDELPSSVHDAQSKFHFYFKLTKNGTFHDQLLNNVHKVYNSVLDVCQIAHLFDSEEKRRFLMHLVAHIYFINRTNAIGSETIRRTINVFSTLNHSCAPNLYTRYAGKVHHCTTIRPVKKGEQLFISYLGTEKQTLNERLAEIESKWHFICNCDKCQPIVEPVDHKKMIEDPTFTFVTENYKKMDKRSAVLEKCENFLNKYASWSNEIEAVSDIYISTLILEHFENTLQSTASVL